MFLLNCLAIFVSMDDPSTDGNFVVNKTKGESQNGRLKKIKHTKFSQK